MHRETCAKFFEGNEELQFEEEDHEQCIESDTAVVKDMLDMIEREIGGETRGTVPRRAKTDGALRT
jgi:hypothetical protein